MTKYKSIHTAPLATWILSVLAGAGWSTGALAADAVAILHGTQGSPNVKGTVTFTEKGDKTEVSAELQGLKPSQKHGFHIHEFGDCSAPDAKSAGGHYNPGGHEHALPKKSPRHAGDFGNLEADKNGMAKLKLTVDNITISGKENPILGHAMIIHADSDKGTQPSGDAGGRIACGVIGIAQPHPKK